VANHHLLDRDGTRAGRQAAGPEAGGGSGISLVMTGTDGLSAGIKNNLLTQITPTTTTCSRA